MIAIYRGSIHNIMYACIYVQIASYVYGCCMLYSKIMQVAPVQNRLAKNLSCFIM